MKPYEGQVWAIPQVQYQGQYQPFNYHGLRVECMPKEKPAPKKQNPLRHKMGKKELAYTAMLEDLYRRAMKIRPEELDAFIKEVKEKLPGYVENMGPVVRQWRYWNGMHATALAGIAAMASISMKTSGYAISCNQAGVITHLIKEGFWCNFEYVARVR